MKKILLIFILLVSCEDSRSQEMKKLSKGDTIGIVSVSSSVLDFSYIDRGVKYLESLGYNVVLASNVMDNEKFFPGSPQTRANELMRFFEDPNIDMIMSVRGGFGSIQILEFLDYKVIKKNPKIFVGFSDITALQQALHQKANLSSFHGPMLASNFGDEKHSPQTDKWLFSLLSGETTTIYEGFKILNQGSKNEVNGVILGGNLITFMSLMGTKYQPDLKDKILFFEEVGENTYAIDRALSQLLLNNQIHQVRAFAFGDFSKIIRRNNFEETLEELIINRLSPLNIPIISGIPSGHSHPMSTVPIGAEVKINLEEKRFELEKLIVK